MKREIPESMRRALQKAGRARAAQITPEQRKSYGRKAWQTRIKNATKKG